MCFSCYREFGSPKIINEKTIYASKLIDEVYKYEETGGCLHIVLDDFNIEDRSLSFCENDIKEEESKPFPEDDEDKDWVIKSIELQKNLLECLKNMTIKERASSLALSKLYGILKIP